MSLPFHPLAPRAYRDPEHFEREQEVLFAPHWGAVAHVSQLSEPGCYVATDLHGTPVVIVRGADGNLRGLSNVCRHRSYPIMRGAGKAERFVCPYHAWSYDLDGKLLRAPYMDGTPGFDPTACVLPEVRIEVWQGFVFANLDPGAEPLGPQLRGLEEVIRPYAIAELQVVGQHELPQPWNWKVMAENFAEGYHHSTQHVESIPDFPTQTSVCLEPDDGPYWIYDNHGRPGSTGQRLLGIGVFPHTLFAVSENNGRRSVVWLHLRQLGPTEHQLVISALADERIAGSPERSQRFTDGLLTFHREDQALCRETQRGLASAYAGLPNLCRSQERVIERFHGWICAEFDKAA
ncbi:MAG: aromatic ring-hydroxylating dioxygenase subunit alpha [Gammaproteobacteria bacterium]|nr:aromatic ring-hydroxylating dioxygenase subunit alpha [Gammaproteobacteria bacterium]MYE83953.1 aromatic ring-hydroxylating dioxygenase subunit alpha [Gammaproteobacteria bacterium]